MLNENNLLHIENIGRCLGVFWIAISNLEGLFRLLESVRKHELCMDSTLQVPSQENSFPLSLGDLHRSTVRSRMPKGPKSVHPNSLGTPPDDLCSFSRFPFYTMLLPLLGSVSKSLGLCKCH